ncbi:MAG: glutamate racemase [Rikenellaceae bacterium]
MDSRPIGVYDSGMGGISLWQAIKKAMPNEAIIYLGDGQNCPYGDKTSAEITSYAFAAVEELLARGCKMIVVACNTATSVAIDQLRCAHPSVPFVGMEPAVKPACSSTRTGIVAVLATRKSLESDMFANTLSKYANGVEVIKCVGEGFVELVEQGLEGTDKAYTTVKPIVEELVYKGVDKIVLGCTHYPFLAPQICRAIGDRHVEVVDPSPAIVRRIERLLDEFNLGASDEVGQADEFLSFAGAEYVNMLINRAKELII